MNKDIITKLLQSSNEDDVLIGIQLVKGDITDLNILCITLNEYLDDGFAIFPEEDGIYRLADNYSWVTIDKQQIFD